MRVFWLLTSACVATFPRMLQDPGPLVHLRLAIAGGTPAARHTLYYLDELAELVLALEAEVRPALVAAVERLVNGIRITIPGSGYRGGVDVAASDPGHAAVEGEVLTVTILNPKINLVGAAPGSAQPFKNCDA